MEKELNKNPTYTKEIKITMKTIKNSTLNTFLNKFKKK